MLAKWASTPRSLASIAYAEGRMLDVVSVQYDGASLADPAVIQRCRGSTAPESSPLVRVFHPLGDGGGRPVEIRSPLLSSPRRRSPGLAGLGGVRYEGSVRVHTARGTSETSG